MFQKAKASNKLEIVAMNQIKYVQFAANRHGLGTEDLNACTAVVIASPTAAILGHFSPRPPGAPANSATGDAHIQAKMDQISTFLKNHKANFPQNNSTGLIAYAVYRGEVALPSQKTIIESRFKQWGIPLKRVEYIVLESNQPRPSGKGSVMVIHQDAKVYLFVEDKARDVVPKSSSGSSAAESSTSVSTPTAKKSDGIRTQVSVRSYQANGQLCYSWEKNGVEDRGYAKDWTSFADKTGKPGVFHKGKNLFSMAP